MKGGQDGDRGGQRDGDRVKVKGNEKKKTELWLPPVTESRPDQRGLRGVQGAC